MEFMKHWIRPRPALTVLVILVVMSAVIAVLVAMTLPRPAH